MDGTDAAMLDAFNLPTTTRPEPHFHTAQLRADLAAHPAALLERLRLLVGADEANWRALARHVLYSRLSVYRNEVLCAHDGEAGVLGAPAAAAAPAHADPLTPTPPWRATVDALRGLFAGPPAAAVGVDGAARPPRAGPLHRRPRRPPRSRRPRALPARHPRAPSRDRVAPAATDSPGGGGGPSPPTPPAAGPAVRVHATPAGPRRALAFLAARAGPGAYALARLPPGAGPVMVYSPADGGGGTVGFDDFCWYAFPPASPPGPPSPAGGRRAGAGARACWPARGPQPSRPGARGSGAPATRGRPRPPAAAPPGAGRLLWTLLLEPDADAEAHVVLAEEWRVATAGHPLLAGGASPFGAYEGRAAEPAAAGAAAGGTA